MPSIINAAPGSSAPAVDSSGLSEPELIQFLSAVPTETTLGERLLLYKLFSTVWSGSGKVVEIGPFLGGTTRAIAFGMLQNPHRSPDAILHTFDRFDSYCSAQLMRQTVQPMVVNKTFTAEQADDLCRNSDFERLFDAIHAPHPYASVVRLHNSPLPDVPQDLPGSTALACIDDGSDLGALFVDGCKSWTSTYYAMKTLLPRMPAGEPVIFQDFGWYTCFWVSSVVYALRDFFELVTYVDATYVFRLKRRMSAEDVVRRFKPTPEEMGERFFADAAAALLATSVHHHDVRGELISKLHHVAALITIGRKRQAADVLKSLDVRRYSAFVDMISGCIKSPTYHSGSTPIRWNDPS